MVTLEVGEYYKEKSNNSKLVIKILGYLNNYYECEVIVGDRSHEVGDTFKFGDSSIFAYVLEPYEEPHEVFMCDEAVEPPVKTYDYIKYPINGESCLDLLVTDLLTIYNAVTIQTSEGYYILKCEYIEKEGE